MGVFGGTWLAMTENSSRWFAETETQVQFNHLDPMEIVWHGHYVNYLELARSALRPLFEVFGGVGFVSDAEPL